MTITKLSQMFGELKQASKKRLIAAYANDSHSLGAIHEAARRGFIEVTLTGDSNAIKEVCKQHSFDTGLFNIVHEPDEIKATQKAVAMIRDGQGDILMKGLVSTDKYMRAILNKETGIMESPKAILSHISVIETPNYPKLLIVADVAIIPQPDLNQKIIMIEYLKRTAYALGIGNPKIAVLAATEQMLPGMQACVDAAIISKMAQRGQIKGALIDGPLALDVAIDKESCEIKKLDSPVAGEADCILFPNIESGNVFFKTNTKLCNGELGAVVFGAKVPAILTSRGDSELTKLYSITLAALLAK